MKEHDCNGDCGCSEHEGDDEQVTVTLTLDDGTVLECAILSIFPAGEKEYIALLPLDENGENDEGDVFLYRFSVKDDEPSLENIEDDDEYEIVTEAFEEMLDSQEYDELIDDIDDDQLS